MQSTLKFIIQYTTLPLLILWSVLVESAFFYTVFEWIGTQWIQLVIMMILVFIIESIKLCSGLSLIQSLYHPNTKKQLIIVFALLFFMSFGGSVYVAVKGAPLVSDRLFDRQDLVVTIDLDKIHSDIDQRIERERLTLKDISQTKWRGVLRKDAVALATKVQDNINRMESQRDHQVARAEATFVERQRAQHNKKKISRQWLSNIGGVSEILQVFCFVIIVLLAQPRESETAREVINPIKKTRPIIVPAPNPSVLKKESLKDLRKKLSQYKWKLKHGIGKPETAKRNIKLLNELIDEIKSN